MKIVTEGLSRIVFVFDNTVIKIPWINFFKMIKCFIKYKKDGIFNKKSKRFHSNKILGIFYYLFYIISSNRREYLYFKKHPKEKSLLPILKSFMFGYIIIQPRGDVLNSTNPRWNVFLLKLTKMKIDNIDLLTSSNFCIFNGSIKLLDYGSDLTKNALNTFGFEIIYE